MAVGAGVTVVVSVKVGVAVGEAIVTIDPVAGAPVTTTGRLDPPVTPEIEALLETPV